jgi:hypothetical protein
MYLGLLESPFDTLRQVKINDASVLRQGTGLVECEIKNRTRTSHIRVCGVGSGLQLESN